MNSHAEIAPSSMARTVQCQGSVKLCKMFPSQPNESSLEGEAAHWLAHQYADLSTSEVYYDVASNGIEITYEMREGAELWLGACQRHEGIAWHLEETAKHPVIHEKCWGTPDFWAYDAKTKTLHVMDYKFGFGYVDVKTNWQLITYALLIIYANGLKPDSIEMTIVQPRYYGKDGPDRSTSLRMDQLLLYLPGLQRIASLALSDNAICVVGPECRYCSARVRCETNQQASGAFCEFAGKPVPIDLTNDQMAREYKLLNEIEELISSRRKGLEQELMGLLKIGQDIPGYQLEQGYGRERWKSGTREVKALGEMFGVKTVLEIPITPKQAIKAGMLESVVRTNSETPLGALKLIETQDKTKRYFK